jgi:hypothetical protein
MRRWSFATLFAHILALEASSASSLDLTLVAPIFLDYYLPEAIYPPIPTFYSTIADMEEDRPDFTGSELEMTKYWQRPWTLAS